MALHMRLHDVGRDGMKHLTDGPVSLVAWESLVDTVLGQMLAQRKLYLMHERNQAALEKLHRKDHDAEHEDLQQRFRQMLADPAIPLRNRVKMAASFGAIFSVLFMAGDTFEGTTTQELGELLRQTIHDISRRKEETGARQRNRAQRAPNDAQMTGSLTASCGLAHRTFMFPAYATH